MIALRPDSPAGLLVRAAIVGLTLATGWPRSPWPCDAGG
jgi:hypothetical protein